MVVQGKGKFEELMVCSHEIAASTAQLVAASKVSMRPKQSFTWRGPDRLQWWLTACDWMALSCGSLSPG